MYVRFKNMKPLLLGMLLTFSAFAQKIQIEADQAVDFSRFRTFALGEPRLNSRNPSLIQRFLGAKGLTLVPSGPADLNVHYTLGAVTGSELEAYPAGWRGWGTRVVRVPFTEGTLVIDLRDPTTHSLVWRAIAREEKRDPSKIEGKLDDMVKKSFAKYPPKLPKMK